MSGSDGPGGGSGGPGGGYKVWGMVRMVRPSHPNHPVICTMPNSKDLSKQIKKVPNSSRLVGQTASGPPSYIQVGPPGSDFHGPGPQKIEFKSQTPQKLIILGLLKFVRNSPIKPVLGYYCLIAQ